jgi:hypothetical protein
MVELHDMIYFCTSDVNKGPTGAQGPGWKEARREEKPTLNGSVLNMKQSSCHAIGVCLTVPKISRREGARQGRCDEDEAIDVDNCDDQTPDRSSSTRRALSFSALCRGANPTSSCSQARCKPFHFVVFWQWHDALELRGGEARHYVG